MTVEAVGNDGARVGSSAGLRGRIPKGYPRNKSYYAFRHYFLLKGIKTADKSSIITIKLRDYYHNVDKS